MSGSPRVIVRSKRRVFDGFFKLDEVLVSHRQFDGTMSAERPLLIFERGDAVAALILNRDSGEVVLVEQFRVPTLEKGRNDGWMIEVPAGMIRGNESPEQAVVREVFEETGYRIENPEHVATFFSSPGGTSERIFLFYAVVEDVDKIGPGVGNREDGEDIKVITMSVEDLFERLRQAAVEDPKLIIAAHHLKERVRTDRQRPKVLGSGTLTFAMKSNPNFVIGIKTGEILKVQGVDVWVNSENTDMMMDRVIDKSVSANIRYGGAEKEDNGTVRVDTIARALRRELRGRVYVRLGTVLETEPGELIAKGVKHIVHVAAVDGIGPGKGVRADADAIEMCFNKVLRHIHKGNGRLLRKLSGPDRSVLVPLLGTGEGGLTPGQVAPRIVDAALEFFADHPQTALKEVYLLAYKRPEKDACMKALLERTELDRVAEPSAEAC
jgi:nudix-type nucleoside diphosphatase (YffH/AdpP family)